MITVPEDGFTVSRPRRISVESFGLGRQSDTIETLNLPFLSRVVQAAVGTLLSYARPVLDDNE